MDNDTAISITLNGTPKNAKFINLISSEKKLNPNQTPSQEREESEIKFNNLKEMEKYGQEAVEEFNTDSDVEKPREPLQISPEENTAVVTNLNPSAGAESSPVVRLDNSGNPDTKDIESKTELRGDGTSLSNSSPFEDFSLGFDIEKEVKELKNKVNKNIPAKTKGKDRRSRYKNFIPQSKDEIEKEESGPDKLPQEDVLYKTRHSKEY